MCMIKGVFNSGMIDDNRLGIAIHHTECMNTSRIDMTMIACALYYLTSHVHESSQSLLYEYMHLPVRGLSKTTDSVVLRVCCILYKTNTPSMRLGCALFNMRLRIQHPYPRGYTPTRHPHIRVEHMMYSRVQHIYNTSPSWFRVSHLSLQKPVMLFGMRTHLTPISTCVAPAIDLWVTRRHKWMLKWASGIDIVHRQLRQVTKRCVYPSCRCLIFVHMSGVSCTIHPVCATHRCVGCLVCPRLCGCVVRPSTRYIIHTYRCRCGGS